MCLIIGETKVEKFPSLKDFQMRELFKFPRRPVLIISFKKLNQIVPDLERRKAQGTGNLRFNKRTSDVAWKIMSQSTLQNLISGNWNFSLFCQHQPPARHGRVLLSIF